MNKENWQWLLLTLVVVGLVGQGAMFVNQGSQLSQMAQSFNIVASKFQELAQTQNAPVVTQPVVTTEPAPVQQNSAPSDEYKVITQETVTWNGGVYQFVHRCKGETKVADQQSVPFCIGSNQLAVIDPSSNINVLKTDMVNSATDAPVLFGSDLIYGSKKGTVLISYALEGCATTNDCGAGMPNNYVRFAYNLSDKTFKPISKFPEYGKPIWNPSGTKAIFYPYTCGGAGCDTVQLTGYDLSSDVTKSVTNISAAGNEQYDQHLTDVSGTVLPVWLDITWKNDSDFTAIILNPDGSKKQVSGKF